MKIIFFSLAHRFDGLNHWIVSNELDAGGKPRRRNCKQCTLDHHRDNKTVYMCEKCETPLHVHCFKERILCTI
jgi:hypothetical protein